MFQCRAKEKQGGTMWNTDKPTRSSRLLQTLETSQECSFSFIRFCVAQSINFFWALCGQWVLQRFMKKVALFADDKCYNFSWLTFTIKHVSTTCILNSINSKCTYFLSPRANSCTLHEIIILYTYNCKSRCKRRKYWS